MSEVEYWLSMIQRGRISRREFFGRAAALGVSTVMATTLLSKAGIAEEPKQGGFARFAISEGGTTDVMDPATWPGFFTQNAFAGSMCNGLTVLNEKGEIVPDLAESYESSNGTKTWMIKLRSGLTFHNGKSVTVNDVVESFRYHMSAASKSAAKSLLTGIADIKQDGPSGVLFTLNEGSADFPYILSDYHLVVMPAKDGGGIDWRSGVATGPFTLENFVPGTSAKLKRFANYHKTGKPHFDEVEFLVVSDVSARVNALITGEVHFMDNCDLKTLGALSRNPAIKVLEVPGIGFYTFAMDTQAAPFNDVNVRLAVKYALDREEIHKKIFLGHAVVGNDNPIAASLKYATNPLPVHKYDPDMATHYLQKAGHSSIKLSLSVAETGFPGAVNAAVLYKAQAAKAGIDITVVREPEDSYWDAVYLKKPWCAVNWYGRATCDWMFTTAYAAGAAWNDTKWNNAHFNDLLVKARSELDDTKRAAMYAEMQQLVHDDGGVIVVAFNNWVNAHSTKLAHGEVNGIWPDDNFRMSERWWFA